MVRFKSDPTMEKVSDRMWGKKSPMERVSGGRIKDKKIRTPKGW